MSIVQNSVAQPPTPGRAYVIEIAGSTAGIVAYDDTHRAYSFYAADPFWLTLEGTVFASPAAAEKAARARLTARPVGQLAGLAR